MFTQNVGMLDRVIRVILGAVILAAFFYFPDTPWRWLALIGLVPLLTGLFGSCLIYSIFGMSTRPRHHA